jgi:hypothetical protein
VSDFDMANLLRRGLASAKKFFPWRTFTPARLAMRPLLTVVDIADIFEKRRIEGR